MLRLVQDRSVYLSVLVVALGIALFSAGIYIGQYFLPIPSSLISSDLRDKSRTNYKYVNPLLSCGDIQSLAPADVKSAEEDVRTYIDIQKKAGTLSDIGVYYRDLNNGPWFSIDSKKTFSPGSLLKVPILISVYSQSQKDPTLFEKKIHYPGDTSGMVPTIPPKDPLVAGRDYTVQELAQHMTEESDNNAALLLYQFIGPDVIASTYSDLAFDAPQVDKDYSISVRTYATVFRILFNATYLSPTLSEKVLGILTKSDFTSGLVAGVPPGTAVAHKFGEREYPDQDSPAQLHDCGIIYAPPKPYVLCIMTRGNSTSDLSPIIAKISNIVYSHVTN